MSEVRKGGPIPSGMSHDNSKPPRRMMIFVITIFLIACLVALAFTWMRHPGEPDEKSPTATTEQTR
ncbi:MULTISPECIES: hypothetical protein [Rhizobium]|uniref:Uncharacterized protein n=1 Tax=Rhizobium bangladeshense TaxID=1138189 RepID=A0ABS7LQW7_9HYPH|nr:MULTISPECIES: hypothetical protein [Rhizobium]MBX4870508.1 hypothetical protein [Rhizobium bangladeshense]MBX4875962.1 hypothetical protein [Rhizobium bangladeshense]MBX4887050.1 hypothetical protein [Rhizobium bangladeshense]MBX4893165.1 hypothetical protein [Rhizobium bangladeshense]MBX4905291.1 hypothetical protein [Rhizobium bangladeshense]